MYLQVSSNCTSNNLTVHRLIKGHEYQFRIAGQNKYGVGAAILSDPVIAKVSYTTPDTPGRPEYCTSTPDSITISYARPQNDGGNEIIGMKKWIQHYRFVF